MPLKETSREITPPGSLELCVNLCEVASPSISPTELEGMVGRACREAGFPYCERIYAGSYFCDDYFCKMGNRFHESLQAFCQRHDVRATLVIPIVGQAFLDRAERRIDDALDRHPGLYDEVVANDVARFLDVSARHGKRMGLGRLFSKTMRDARIESLMERRAVPTLSAEALECLASYGNGANRPGPIVELDPIAGIVDASGVLGNAPCAEIALHLPLCFATTGRNCVPASIEKSLGDKFLLGRDCDLACLRIGQDYLTDEGIPYRKQGRTFFFENPGCAIAGTPSWRIVYQAGMHRISERMAP